jgi:hypothetical protein
MSEPLIFDVQVLTANISSLFTLQDQMLQTCGICQKDSRRDVILVCLVCGRWWEGGDVIVIFWTYVPI